MIVVITELEVRPEKSREFLQTVLALIDPMRKEKGCNSCRFYVNMENDRAFSLIEEWETQADLEKHLRSEKSRVMSAAMTLMCKLPQRKNNTNTETGEIGLILNRFHGAH